MTDYSWFGNLDMTGYVNGLLTSAKSQLSTLTQNKLAPIQAVQVSLNGKMSNYTQVDKLLSNLNSSIGALNKAFNPTPQINTSNPNTVTATQISGQALATGSHTLNISTLAQASTFASAAQSSATGALNSTDTLTIQMGASGPSFQIAVSATDSLQTIKDKINTQADASNMGVAASVISSSSGNYQLVINAKQTGVANEINVTNDSTGSAQPLNVTQTQPANDAAFTFDGVPMVQASNSNIAIGGLNVTLLGTGTASLNVTSSSPISTVIDATKTVVNDYNNLMIELSKDQVTAGSDGALASIQSTLQNLFQGRTMVGQGNDLYGVGIQLKNNTEVDKVTVTLSDGSTSSITPAGILEVDSDALTSALSANYASVQTLLTDTTNGVFNQAKKMISAGGDIYKNLHDVQFGAEVTTQSQLTDIQKQIKQINSDYTDQQQALKMKYANILVMMVQMQTQSQALSSQIASLGK